MMRISMVLSLGILFLELTCAAQTNVEFLMGSVVKSDIWKMDRANNLETFTGNVSFRNPRYTLKADHAVYNRASSVWDLNGSVYTLRNFPDLSQVETYCDHARYEEKKEQALLERGVLPVRMRYRGPDGRVLNGRADQATGESKDGLMHFTGSFSLATENLELYSEKGLYDNAQRTFLLYYSSSPASAEGRPVAVGKREGYDFAIAAESAKFFRDSRDIKFYNKVTGWTKDSSQRTGGDPEKSER